MKVLVETSARHIHVTKEALETLFGTGHELTIKKNLSQPGEYACEERLDVVGPKNTIKGITILGPCRTATQVELSLTDARTVGIAAPVRESGDTAGTPGCKLVGPAGELDLKEGVIAAKRHIHLNSENAKAAGVENKQIVSVKIDTKDRSLVLGDVVIRVRDSFNAAMHIDTDEANAAGASGEVWGEIVK
ncbi:MAG TPA: phosphate propanoyltransferase [Oscillospiraceae bacterium]|nr:phosphate propanoyltransferase [Oscillospiraceae bacterium]